MVWRTLRAMPLRLLERVMPWLVARLSEGEADEMVNNLVLGAGQVEATLAQLLARWAGRGRLRSPDSSPSRGDSGDHRLYGNATCQPHIIAKEVAGEAGGWRLRVGLLRAA